jgi:hypothetical protein
MEVGGSTYKNKKEELDKHKTDVSNIEKQIKKY